MSTRIRIRVAALVLVGLAAVSFDVASGDDKKAGEYVNAQTARLELLVGPWVFTERHYDSDGGVVAKVTGSEQITWVLDDHAIRRVYASGEEASKYAAIGLLTWNDVEKKYHGVWFDNASTAGPRSVSGQWVGKTQSFVFTLESLGTDGSKTRYKIVERFVDENERVATTYRMNGSKESKLIEVQYKRSKPCPGRIRVILDEEITSGTGP